MEKKYCTYIRVSTGKQNVSGLGLDAQRARCEKYIISQGGVIEKEFCDAESGTSRKRKGLLSAIDYCKDNGCMLVIANLSRLARDIEFTFKVINTGIDIHFCDMPQINTLILGVMASVAQYEREETSRRTKAALAENKKRGVLSGRGNSNYYISPEHEAEAIRKRSTALNEAVIDSLDFKVFCRILRNCYKELDIPSRAEDERFFLRWDTGLKLKADKERIEPIIAAMKEARACNKELFKKVDFEADNIAILIRSRIQSTFKSIEKYHRLNNH